MGGHTCGVTTWFFTKMSGRKKRGSKSRYFSTPAGQNCRKNSLEYCSDKRLLPRIKQYLEDYKDPVVDIDDMAVTLQAEYPEYARKKRLVFRALVAKVYSSISCNDPNERESEEWLEKREQEYMLKRLNREELTSQKEEPADGSVSTSSDSETEMEVIEDFNMMNSSILQLYDSSNTTVATPQSTSASQTDGHTLVEQHSHLKYSSLSSQPQEGPLTSTEPKISDITKNLSQTNKGEDLPRMNPAEQPNAAILSSESKVESETRGKRGRRSPEEEGGTDRVKPRRKRARAKVEKLEKDGNAVVQGELEGKRKQEFNVQTSTVTFLDMAGCDSVLEDVCRLLLHLRHPEMFTRLGVRPPQGFLLHGPPGCGKTLLAHAIAGELKLPFIKLAATEIVSGVSGESEGTIRDLFQVAKEHAPCVLFVDEVDAICPKRETAQREMERRIVTQLLSSLDDLNQSDTGSQVLVIGATSRADTLDPALRRSGRFDREICLGIPSIKQRESILRLHCSGLRLEEGFDIPAISAACPGFVGADVVALVREASLCAINRVLSCQLSEQTTPNTRGDTSLELIRSQAPFPDSVLESTYISQGDFIEALKSVQPSAKREGFATVPDTTWGDVGALEDVREELTMAILAPIRYPDQFTQLGLTSPPGVLLAGPPGCGKTLLAKAIANETGINFISVKGPELLNMYVGESERAVRQVFQRARNSAPCVIFFDELDALCPKRSDMAETNASARVVNQLLTEMDGLESRKQVFVMGATNRPDIIDPAVLRPGRLDKVLYVGLPSSKDREAILRTITKDGTRPKLGPDVSLSQLGADEYSKGFSGADLNALVRDAAVVALKEHMKLKPMTEAQPIPSVAQDIDSSMAISMRHFQTALAKFRPSVSAKDYTFYQKMATRFSGIEDLELQV